MNPTELTQIYASIKETRDVDVMKIRQSWKRIETCDLAMLFFFLHNHVTDLMHTISKQHFQQS